MSEGSQPYRSQYVKTDAPQRDFYVGLDLGQSKDYSALSILERTGRTLTLSHLERLPLDMPYPDQVNYIYSIMNRRPLSTNRKTLVVDYTGCGRPVFDMLRTRGLQPIGLQIHGGNAMSWRKDARNARVPKRDLINSLQVAAQDDRLKISPKLKFGPVLTQELQNFKVKINVQNGHDSYNAREGLHDDLLLATCIACWVAENGQRSRVVPRFVDCGGNFRS